MRSRLQITVFLRNLLRPDAVKNASRCSICYVPTQQKIRPDVVQATSGRNFSFMKTAA